MSKKGTVYLFILFFSIGTFCLNAQTTNEKEQPLIQILLELEKRFSISFSYADQTIEEKFAALPDSDLTLEEILLQLKELTQLEFDILDHRFVTIKSFEEKQKGVFKTQQLNEVFITNYLTSGILKNVDGSLTIQSDNLGILPGLIEADILQTIQALPGILSIDERVSNINVRGGTHDQNLILWDGIKMYQSGHFFGLVSAFNPYLTEIVNVSKNGTSAKYGDGISSVIDMQLSNTISKDYSSEIGFNLINADGFAKIPLSKRTEVQVSARRSIADVLSTPTYNQYFKRIFQDSDITQNGLTNNTVSKNERFYFYDIASKFIYNISENDDVKINFLNIYNNLNYEESAIINNINNASNSQLRQRNLAAGITYNRRWSNQLNTTLKTTFSNYNLDATNFDIANNQRLIQENKVSDGTLKLNFNYIPNKQLSFDFGYQFSEVGISNFEDVNNPVFRRLIKEVLRTNSIYLEWQYVSNNTKSKLKIGARINHIEKFGLFDTEPRFSFNQKLSDHFRLEVLAELKSQTTTQIIDLQNDFLGIEKRRWQLSNNTNIPILKSKQASIGLHYKKNDLLISAEVYYKEVNGITAKSQGFQNQFQYENDIGKYDIKGIDFLIQKQFNRVNTWLSYTYSKNDYKFEFLNEGEIFPNNTDIRHAMTFAGTYSVKDFKLALGLNWHSGKPTTIPVDNNNILNSTINYLSPNNSRLSDYLRADVSSTYKFNISPKFKAIIGASVWNVLNKKNIINTYYVSDNVNSIRKVENESLGITPNISFRIRF